MLPQILPSEISYQFIQDFFKGFAMQGIIWMVFHLTKLMGNHGNLPVKTNSLPFTEIFFFSFFIYQVIQCLVYFFELFIV